MKNVIKQGCQGDVLFRRVEKVPAGFVEVERKGPIIVSHSETGHHHTIDSPDVRVFEDAMKPLVCYLMMSPAFTDAGMHVEHLRSYDTHETLCLLGEPGTVWEARRQREHTPEGWRRVCD